MTNHNRTAEQRARDTIDARLEQAGWKVQSKSGIDFHAGRGIAIREYQTDVGPADYMPPIEEQVEILRRIDVVTSTLDSVEASVTTALQNLDALRQSILKMPFSGHLVPQDGRDEPASVLLDRIRAEREHLAKRTRLRKTGKRKKTTVTA